MRVGLHIIFIISILILAGIYGYCYTDGICINIFSDIDTCKFKDSYTSKCLLQYYMEYKRTYIHNDIDVWKSNTCFYVHSTKSSVLRMPFCGHRYLCSYEYPGGYTLTGGLNSKHFGYDLSKVFSRIPHIITFQGCPVYVSNDQAFVQMPFNQAYAFFSFYNELCGKSGTFENVSMYKRDFNTSLSSWQNGFKFIINFHIYILMFIMFIVIILYYFSFIKRSILYYIIVYIVVLYAAIFLYFYLMDFSSSLTLDDTMINSEVMSNLIPFCAAPQVDFGSLKDICPKYIHPADDFLDHIKNNDRLNIMKYPLYGHNYVIFNSKYSSLDLTFFNSFKKLQGMECIYTFQGCPVYYQWNNLYVQVPIEKVSAMEYAIREHLPLSYHLKFFCHDLIHHVVIIVKKLFTR